MVEERKSFKFNSGCDIPPLALGCIYVIHFGCICEGKHKEISLPAIRYKSELWYMVLYVMAYMYRKCTRESPQREHSANLVLVLDIKSSYFDKVFHHWQVSILSCSVECRILCISKIKHVTSHHGSKVLGNTNMATIGRQVKGIESSLH